MYVKTHYYYYSHFKHEENGVPSIEKLLSPPELDSSATSLISNFNFLRGSLSPRINTSRRWVALTADLITPDEPLPGTGLGFYVNYLGASDERLCGMNTQSWSKHLRD